MVKPLVGVRGWLLFLAFTLIVTSPTLALWSTAREFADLENLSPGVSALESWQGYKLMTWLIVATAAGSFSFAGYKLLRHHRPSSVQTAIYIIWTVPPSTLLLNYCAAYHYFGTSLVAYYDFEQIKFIGQSVFFATIWTAYLKLSKRVRNTYAHETPSESRKGALSSIVAKLVSLISWISFAVIVVVGWAVKSAVGTAGWPLFLVMCFVGLLAFAILQGIVWVIDRLAGTTPSTVLWPYRPKNRTQP